MAVKIVKVLAERKNKTIYRDGDRVIKLFEKKHPKSNILNEALNQARVEEATDLNIPKLLEVTKIKEGVPALGSSAPQPEQVPST